jgi:hypothetical protein
MMDFNLPYPILFSYLIRLIDDIGGWEKEGKGIGWVSGSWKLISTYNLSL